MIRVEQRPFKFEHQRAAGSQRHDIIAISDERREMAGDAVSGAGDGGQVAILELGHAATFGMFDADRNAVVRQHTERRHARRLIVEIAIAGRIERDFLAKGGAVWVGRRHLRLLMGQRNISKGGEVRAAMVGAGTS